MTPFDYLLRANLYLLIFFGCYYLLLRRHTFFTLNRVYLLASVALAFGLPFVQLPGETVAALPVVRPQVLEAVIIRPAGAVSTGPDWVMMAWWLYGLVAFGLLCRVVWRTWRLLAIIRNTPQQTLPTHTLVEPADSDTPTFSFFRYMVLSQADAASDPVQEHELVHIRQWHSADVLLFEIVQALFWYNPILLAYRVAIREVHEFLADQVASARHRSAYANYLVSYALGGHPDALTNSFFRPSLLLSRLRMLSRRATKRWALGKYALVLPLVALVLGLTAARPEVERLVEPLLVRNPVVVKGRVMGPGNKPLPGANIVVVSGNKGTTTDPNGRFMISVEPGTKLVVSFVGYESQEVMSQEGQEIQVTLAVEPRMLNNLVVTGYSPEKAQSQTSGMKRGKETFTVIEQNPEFPGGMTALSQYLARTIRYPAAAQQGAVTGRVYVEFVVSALGEINNICIKKGIGFGCDEEAVRVVAQMPRWTPGRQNGQPVNVVYILPIQFALESGTGLAQPKSTLLDTISDPRLGDFGVPQPGVKNALPTEPQSPLSQIPQGTRVYLRGNAFSTGDPLYILDGVKLNRDYSLNTLNPNEIQSVDVLKGPSARATYGEEGANGVIIITTKTGQKHEHKPAEPVKH